jgi:hypothetical protein
VKITFWDGDKEVDFIGPAICTCNVSAKSVKWKRREARDVAKYRALWDRHFNDDPTSGSNRCVNYIPKF